MVLSVKIREEEEEEEEVELCMVLSCPFHTNVFSAPAGS